jgi:hypothetical protein
MGGGVTGALNLSAEDAAFINGLTLTTSKRISSRGSRPILDKFLQITSHVAREEWARICSDRYPKLCLPGRLPRQSQARLVPQGQEKSAG